MKKFLIPALVAALCSMVAACGGSSKSADEQAAPEIAAVSVDEVLANPENFLGDTIVIEGVCTHLCSHGGKKAFIAGSADSVMLRCEAYPLMGEPFPKTVIRHPLQVKGVLCEERIDEEALLTMERNARAAQQQEDFSQANGNTESAQADSAAPKPKESGCATERASRGQSSMTTLDERIADYRKRIAERQASEGKPYLSFYYLQAESYEVLPD